VTDKLKRVVLRKGPLFTALVLAVVLTVLAVMPVTASATPANTNLSQGQRNIVLRARQVNEIEWTPLKDVPYFAKKGFFKAGETIRGMPYSRPLEENYVPAKKSLSVFAAAVKDINSPFYTIQTARGNTTLYYGLDCSGFVTWAWGLETRHMTTALHQVSTNMGKNINTIQVGDSLNKSGTHATLITEVRRDSNGAVTAIGLMELVQPKIKYTLFGTGGSQPLSEVNRQFLNNGYSILRYKHRDSVRYFHDCAVPIDDDDCDKCRVPKIVYPVPPFTDVENGVWYVDAVRFAVDRKLFSGTHPESFSPEAAMTRGMFITVLSRFAGVDVSGYTAAPFLDVPVDAWYGKAVAWAAGAGMIAVNSDLYRAEQSITRSEMARAVYAYLLWANEPLPYIDPSVLFADDDEKSDELKEAVYALNALGIMRGDSGNRFNPNGAATRAEAAQLFRNLAAAVEQVQPFTDVRYGAWYFDAVKLTVRSGIFTGTGPATFSPGGMMTHGMFTTVLSRLTGAEITDATGIETGNPQFEPDLYASREDMALYIYNHLLWAGAEKTGDDTGENTGVPFYDDDDISELAKTAVYTLRAYGFLSGDENNFFNPLAPVTRAETAQVISNMLLSGIL